VRKGRCSRPPGRGCGVPRGSLRARSTILSGNKQRRDQVPYFPPRPAQGCGNVPRPRHVHNNVSRGRLGAPLATRGGCSGAKNDTRDPPEDGLVLRPSVHRQRAPNRPHHVSREGEFRVPLGEQPRNLRLFLLPRRLLRATRVMLPLGGRGALLGRLRPLPRGLLDLRERHSSAPPRDVVSASDKRSLSLEPVALPVGVAIGGGVARRGELREGRRCGAQGGQTRALLAGQDALRGGRTPASSRGAARASEPAERRAISPNTGLPPTCRQMTGRGGGPRAIFLAQLQQRTGPPEAWPLDPDSFSNMDEVRWQKVDQSHREARGGPCRVPYARLPKGRNRWGRGPRGSRRFYDLPAPYPRRTCLARAP